jgi:hypothetical protein
MRVPKPPIFDPFANDPGTQADSDLFNEPVYLGQGFPAPAGVPVRPPLGYFNWLFFQTTAAARYLFQRGIADWDATEPNYSAGDIVRYVDNKFYVCTGTPTTGTNPTADPNNWQLWLASPIAVASSWAQQIWGWRNAKQQRGSVINHQGIVDGRILTIEEDWIGGDSHGPAAANGAWFGRWNYAIFNSGGHVFANAPATDLGGSPWGPRAGVTIIDGAFPFDQSAAVIEMRRAFMLGGSPYIALETAFSVNPNGAGTLEDLDTFALGFGDGTLISSASVSSDDVGTAAPAGAYLVKPNGETTWFAVSRSPGGAVSSTDTGVAYAANVSHRYRVEIIAASASDDNTDRVIHSIDGAVINHARAMDGAMLTPYIRTSGEYQGPHVHSVLNVGRVRLTARLELGDVSI